MKNHFAVYSLLLILFYLSACQASKKPQEVPAAAVEEKDPRAVAPGTFEGDFQLIWKDDEENNSASMYDVSAESMVFGDGILYYITGPKEPEGGSFSQVKALDLKARKLLWSRKFVTQHLTKIDLENGLVVITGYQGFGDMFDGFSYVFAFRAGSGELAWKTKIENQPYGGGLFDMAVHGKNVYLLCERNDEEQKLVTELLSLNFNSGEIETSHKLGRHFFSDIGTFNAPFFLTKTNPQTLKKELVTPKGNAIIIGKEWIELAPGSGNSSREVNSLLAVNLATGKTAWQYQDNRELFNSITGWQLSGKDQIIHFEKPLNDAGYTGLDIATGNEVLANARNIEVAYNGERAQSGSYKDLFAEVSQKPADYKVKYRKEDVWVYEKLKK